MERLSEWIVRHRHKLLLCCVVLLLLSTYMNRFVVTNYEMSKYLSPEMDSVKSLEIMKAQFGLPTNVRVMVKNISMHKAAAMKAQIARIDGVDSILWLNDVADIYTPLDMINPTSITQYYRENDALFYVYFTESDFTKRTGAALREIERIVGDDAFIFGTASSSQDVIAATESNIATLGVIFVPLILLILLWSTTSWLEPFLFLITLGVAILLNNGTNILLGEVSFITKSMSTALQLAISMDYAIFLLHRFAEERVTGHDVQSAMQNAITKSFGSILASSITTVAGFLALLLMNFKIGTDMGLVFAKGISLSLLTTLFLLPALTILFSKWIDQTHHRSFIPSMKGLGNILYKMRYLSFVLVLILMVPTFLGQQANVFTYGGSSISEEVGTKSYIAKQAIENVYGAFNPLILLVPAEGPVKEKALVLALQSLKGIEGVQSLSTMVDDKIPVEILPKSVTDAFVKPEYHRLIVALNLPEEGDATFDAVSNIKAQTNLIYGDKFAFAGTSVSLYDIKVVAAKDNLAVNLVAIAAVAMIIFFTFKSKLLPFLLVFTIEAAVFLNMSIPYFTGYKMNFIGMLVVSSLQLGATIDYAILMTSRYLERRQDFAAKEAIVLAIDDAGGSILTSGIVLTIAGYVISATSSVQTVSEIGALIGRGTLFSVVMVFTVLPAVLVIFDRFYIEKQLHKGVQ